ncbi:predicted protein [Naegleria gruberi]|uniref:Predicted protein n=1 Tax=Naegleria gruberi TaxID=5762 RepID=D2UXB9_NAEGR|nr:uncharacterized protein NAEGRDRAFT_61070 [Naegleria gruberi]EFC50606.1 predicted protein [Naegleria gruberi]|eukprot:XP_002683350.1 predicted protein [Naegleria gruberi strain NEG-M]
MSSFNLASMLGLKNSCNNPSLSCLFEKYTDTFSKIFGASSKLHSLDEIQLDKILKILDLCNIYEKHENTSGLKFETEKKKKIYLIEQYYKNPDSRDVEFLINDFKKNNEMAGSPIHDSEQRQNMFKTKENFQASKKSLEAYSKTKLFFDDDLNSINIKELDNILKIADESLKISPNCIEAFNILGLYKSNNYEQALKYFREGQEKKDEYYSSNLKFNEKDNWTKHELRQYFRSIIGEANILRKMGKYQEALDSYNRAVKLDAIIHGSMVSYCNFQYNIPECLMKLGKWKEAYDFMKKNKDLLSLASSKVLLWSFALCDFMIKKKSSKDNSVEEHVEFIESGREKDSELYGSIAVAALNSPLVYEYLLGIRKLANVRIPNSLVFSSDESSICSQAQYISDHLDLWLSNPEALEWAIKNANIINSHLTLNNEEKKLGRKYFDNSKPFDNFFKLYSKLYFPDSRADVNLYLLHCAVRAKNLDAVKLLVDQGATIYTKSEPTPFHFACYYDYGSDIVKYFCEKTGTPLKTVKIKQSPLIMAINQGNWKPLVEILSYLLKKNSLTNDILQTCVKELFNTSVYECVKGLEKCQRCYMTNVPHSNDVSFEKCVDAIILFGLKLLNKFYIVMNRSTFKKIIHAIY